jgi:ATP-binding cassette, subfamily F, member 3
MASGTLSGAQIADAGRRLAHVGAEVAKLEERWLELNEQIELLQAGA